MIEKQIEIRTSDGAMNTFICHPERGGPHPVIIFFMDAPGIREELRDMARRLGTSGYYVMLPNLYYRSGVEGLGPYIGPANASTREKMGALMKTISVAMIADDTGALIAFAESDTAASKGAIGAVGYCMSGQYAIGAADRYTDRVKSVASIYGTSLITDTPDSPHLLAGRSKAQLYFAWAENDSHAPLDQIPQLQKALSQGGANAEIEIYKATEHGFAFPERPTYNKAGAERHWERILALFGSTLK